MNKNQNFFMLNYKFINFQKPNDTSDSKAEYDQSVQNFYQDLIKTKPSTKSGKQTNSCKEKSEHSTQIAHTNLKIIDPKEFLSACQNNDLKTVDSFLSNNGDIFYKDEFKWNCIMISIVSFNLEILCNIIESIRDENVLKQLLNDQDLSGNTAESLAEKVKNTDAIELLKRAKENFLSKNSKSEIIDVSQADDDSDFFCESCNKKFKLKDISHREHKTSIVHLINENSSDLENNKKILANYHLRGCNKGYQLMLKYGWNERGLGSKEQGRIIPIKTRQKLDRFGIGIEKSTKTYTKPLANIKIKNNKSDSALLKKAKSLKDTIEENKRSQRFERNFRRYFDL